MPDYCIERKASDKAPRKHCCPVNGQAYGLVGLKTLLHHIRQPWTASLGEQAYYFCSDPECEVVYFGQDGMVIRKSALRTQVGIKEAGSDQLVCYCFGVTQQQAMQNKSIRDYVIDQTKKSLCSCETSNPSGHCCIAGFPRH